MINVNLVGNANTGKTTLFNSLTGAHEHVGNWHGVTVEEKAKRYSFKGQEINIVDLPGIYSLTSLSYEEKVAVDYILKTPDRLVVNICDASNLQRNLYLTLGLLELGVPVILAVNQIDKKPICKIDYKSLGNMLGIKVIPINARDKSTLGELNDAILDFGNGQKNSDRKILPYIKSLNLDFSRLGKIDEKLKVFYAIKLLEKDEEIAKRLNMKTDELSDHIEEVAKTRYGYIDQILSACMSKQTAVYGRSKFDKIVMNRFLAFPIFLLFLAVAFYLTFFSIGAWCSDGLSFLLDSAFKPLLSWLTGLFGQSSWIVSFFETAIVGALGSILGFLPQVALLFLFLSILEDSGYLSRIAFVFEDILGKVGLSGKSVYTLLMGFGCSTTAVLTARNMEDKNSKIKTGLLTPYMSCSAKFPIYAVLGGAFFGAKNIFVILGLYLLGVVVAILLSFILEKTLLKSKEQTFILEFPPYRSMSLKRVLSVLWDNVKLFLIRVGTLIVSMNVIVWILGNFSFTFSYVASSGGASMLESLGKILAPIFIPLGFGSWGLVSALIAGLIAKEVIVSSIAMFNHVDEASESLIGSSVKDPTSAVYFSSPSAVIAYLVFSLLYFPCLATASVLSKEIGKKWTFIGIIIELLVAYFVAMMVYNISRLIEIFGFWKVFVVAVLIIIVLCAICYLIKFLRKKKSCPYSSKCSGNCKGCK